MRPQMSTRMFALSWSLQVGAEGKGVRLKLREERKKKLSLEKEVKEAST